jgi:L-lactate utilization protein LutC
MENENTKILKELETNSEMGLVQGAKMIEAVDGLEPVMEGILLKTNELVEETKNSKSQVVIHVDGDVESIKGEKGDTPEIDYDKVKEEIKSIYDEDIKQFKDDLTEKLQTHALTVQSRIQPVIEEEVDEKFTELVGVLGGEISKIKADVQIAEDEITSVAKDVKAVSEKVDAIKIPEYDFTPFAKEKDVESKIQAVKKEISEIDTVKREEIETFKDELKKEIDETFNNQNAKIMSRSSKTVSLTELDDVNLDGLTQTNGKYDLGSGSGGGTKEVMFAYLSITQGSNLTSGNHIEFDSISFQQGTGITLATGSGQANGIFTLPAGKIFKITCVTNVTFSGSNGQFLFSAYNDTDNVDIGMPGFGLPYTSTSNAQYSPVSVGYISTVGGSKDMYIYSISAANVTGITGYGDSISTYITIEEI